ncbi:5,10-methylenetetrahydrofolate reductase [Arthrobacter sp. Hiyo4]|nr:5,10-methylenetetrahydrofolate reductase [Arthrobacter sp. Hiyo4]
MGVAAYPTRHPESPSEAHDVEVLLAKQCSGADFAITQVFFHTEQYANLISRARRAGSPSPSSRALCRSPACAGHTARRTDRR